MENTKNYEISFLGEFEDSILEKEFIEQDIQRYIKTIGPIALIFGSIYMMFGISDYLVMGFSISFITILIIRLAFLLASIGLFLMARKIKHYIYMIYMITAYEIFAIIGFLIIANQHESLTILSFFSVIVITLAIYIIPNKLLYSQIASILLSISFFMIYAKNIEGMDLSVLWKIFSYNVIIIIYCNISAYITGFYKRKQFIYSKELLRVSVTDPLTGIYNRGKFNEELNFWIDYYNRYKN